jgi:hypothetical protein
MKAFFFAWLLLIPLSSETMAMVDQVPGIIHLHTRYSTGRYSIEKIARLAEEKGIKIVIITDHPLAEFEYGVPLFRNILKKRVSETSVFNEGVGRYLNEIAEVNRNHPRVLIIPGFEAAPFYYWSGLPVTEKMCLNAWAKHLMVIGIENEEDILNLPMVGNPRLHRYSPCSVLLLWPVILFIFGLFLARKKRTKIIKLKLVKLKVVKSYRKWGILAITLSIILLANNFPFKVAPFDQYHGDKGMMPYQFAIDYVVRKGGVVFIAHPEAEVIRDYRMTLFKTDKYPEMLINTRGYTGFSSLYEGMKECARTGGYWDEALNEYLKGVRGNPPFTIGELDYHYEGEGGKTINQVQTVFLVNECNKDNVIDALRKGRMYALRRTKEYKLVLDDFSLEGEKGVGISGDTVYFSSEVRINIALSLDPFLADEMIKVTVIRNGKPLKELKGRGKIKMSFADRLPEGMTNGYYRIEATTHYPHTVVSNPIFVMRERQ